MKIAYLGMNFVLHFCEKILSYLNFLISYGTLLWENKAAKLLYGLATHVGQGVTALKISA